MVVTGWNSGFSLSIVLLVKISTIDLVATTVTASIYYGFLHVEMYCKIAGTWALVKTGAFVTTKVTAVIY